MKKRKSRKPPSPSSKSSATEQPPPFPVGKGRPPKDFQYKPGQSGNPKGRRKGSKNASTIAREILDGKIGIRTPDGEVQKVTRRMGMLLQCAQKALNGDIKAVAFLLQTEIGQGGEAAESITTPEEQTIIDA